MKDIDADYYGYRDEDDGILVPLEREVEKEVGDLLCHTLRQQYFSYTCSWSISC